MYSGDPLTQKLVFMWPSSSRVIEGAHGISITEIEVFVWLRSS
jgi:hypothetical protein